MQKHSIFTISIDFELFWGTRDSRTLGDYGANILGGRSAIPRLLELFEEFEVHATWAVVGFLLFRDVEELRANLPTEVPTYASSALNPYEELARIGTDGRDPRYFFARDLVDLIRQSPGQEIASHTFSHYYCLEPGQTLDAFSADLQAINGVARREVGREMRSLVFPRNQFNERYLDACKAAGILAYRGNPRSWVYEPRAGNDETLFRRGVRLADSYLNLTGHHGHRLEDLRGTLPLDVPASRFLRPWSRTLRALEPLRLARIKKDLAHAARNGLLYHLWWHPENFGANTDENLAFLRRVLAEFSRLRDDFGMSSLSMGEVAGLVAPNERESSTAA